MKLNDGEMAEVEEFDRTHRRVANAIDNYFLDKMGKPTSGSEIKTPIYEEGDAYILTSAVSETLARAREQRAEEGGDDGPDASLWDRQIEDLTYFLTRWVFFDLSADA